MLARMPGGWLKERASDPLRLLADKVADRKATPRRASKHVGLDRHRFRQFIVLSLPF